MTTKDAIKLVEQAGTKISKDKVLEALKRTSTKELPFVSDTGNGQSLVIVKLG
jgi:hypothetical protein